MADKKSVEDAIKCLECNLLINDNGIMRCLLFDRAIIDDVEEKHCKDSI